ncbi:MAG: tetratricopeptide repeat protein, partial [Proteobacteria bacterium]|nr:tetratricopeptide repeat protein [Pseudomonadota bacterium]
MLLVLLICSSVSCVSNLEVRRNRGEAIRNLGEAYLNQRDYTAALREFFKAQELYPEDPHLYNDFGLAYMAKGEMELAVKHFKKSLALKPDNADVHNNLGIAYLGKKDWDAAIAVFKEVAGNLLYATPQYPLTNLGL